MLGIAKSKVMCKSLKLRIDVKLAMRYYDGKRKCIRHSKKCIYNFITKIINCKYFLANFFKERVKMRKRCESNNQLCWDCKNACGGCSWSSCFKPVDGWDAKESLVKDSSGDFYSYTVKQCPEFIRG